MLTRLRAGAFDFALSSKASNSGMPDAARVASGPGEMAWTRMPLGPKGIRVHAISPGPLATRAASGIPEFDALLDKAKAKAPAKSLVSIDDVGIAVAFLAHDAARLITGETLYIDGGYHIMD